MFQEMGITHRYTRPYRPQTNGKIERFWRTLSEDLLDETTFESVSWDAPAQSTCCSAASSSVSVT